LRCILQVVVKNPRINLRMKGDIPAGIIKALKNEYGDLQITQDKDDEVVNIIDTDWYKSMLPLLTPGKTLRVYRENAGLTQETLGAKVGGVPRQHISGMETGRRPIGEEMAKKLARALNTSPLNFIQI
jgi:DNA-binding XRE family transcriptional regulator